MSRSDVVSVWRIATDTPNYASDDMSGEGARLTGGRWNRMGNPVVYSAQSIALACLESVVHLEFGGLPLNRYLVRIDIPVKVWQQRTVFDAAMNIGWDASPAGKVSLDAGDTWLNLRQTAIMQVPSVIVPEEHNILINLIHDDVRTFAVSKLRKWAFDHRLRG